MRDVRRLVVALSRARLGLYVFGRLDNFKVCIRESVGCLFTQKERREMVLGWVGRFC